MKLIAIGMVKDEADVIGRTIDHLFAQGVDEIILYENGSTDGTWEIVRDLRDAVQYAPGRITIYPDHEVGYFQSRKMSELARAAHTAGADWIIPFDADELWTVRVGGESTGYDNTLKGYLERVEPGVGVLAFANLNHYRTALDPGGHPFDAMGWRSVEPLPLPKVCFRAGPSVIVDAGNHGVLHAPGRRGDPRSGLQIHHFPYRSVEQFIRKARNGSEAYAQTDLPRSTGQHWREWGDTLREHGEAGLRAWFEDAFLYADPAASGLVFDPVRSPA